jgi:hypothetical protein
MAIPDLTGGVVMASGATLLSERSGRSKVLATGPT